MSIINKTPNIMQNAIRGAERQYDLAIDAVMAGDMQLAYEHYDTVELLLDFSKDYIPCLPEEL